MGGYAGYPEEEWNSRMTGWVSKRAGIDITPGSATFEQLAQDLGFLYDTNGDGMLTTSEAYTELKKDMELPEYSGATESAFKELLVTEDQAAENIYRMLDALGAPEDQWADALEYAAEACIHKWTVFPFFAEKGCDGPCFDFVAGATWEGAIPPEVEDCDEIVVMPADMFPSGKGKSLPPCTLVDNSESKVVLMEKLSAEQSGFDWSAAVIGASVGFVASIAALRSCRTKTQQEKRLAEPLL